MMPYHRILEAFHDLQKDARTSNNSAAALHDLLLEFEPKLVPEATLVRETATLLLHSVEQLTRTHAATLRKLNGSR